MSAISKSFWFKNLKEKCMVYIRNCVKCVAFSPKSEVLLHSIPKGDKTFELLYIDHSEPVDQSRSNKHIFLVVDGFTKFVKFYTTKTTNTKHRSLGPTMAKLTEQTNILIGIK